MKDSLRHRAAQIVSEIGGLDKPRQGRACELIRRALVKARAEGRAGGRQRR